VPDMISNFFIGVTPPTPGLCLFDFPTNLTVTEGNIVVRGAL